MIAFFAGSAYQLTSLLNIKRTYFPEREVDLFLTLDLSEQKLRFLKEFGEFRRIVYVDRPREESKSAVTRQIKRVFWRRKKAKETIGNIVYTDFFTPYLYSQALLYYTFAMKINPDIRLHFFDEGIGCYIDSWEKTKKGISLNRKISFSMKLYFRFCNVSSYSLEYLMSQARDIYLYLPAMAEPYNPWIIKEIPINDETKEISRKLFVSLYDSVNMDAYDDMDVVFLESYDKGNMKEFTCRQTKLINQTAQLITRGLFVKAHPALRAEQVVNYDAPLDTRGYPVEYLAARGLLKGSVVVSELSSACFTIPLLLETDIQFILTYKVLGLRGDIEGSLEEFFANFSKEKNLDGVYKVPETLADYKNILGILRGKDENKNSI